ncbi:MAG: hypothetical protein L6416_07425 [Candidatus Omnitrophica bacterium]|nr:hypothetical protein [Candidatus Omnitrophota bacterium]
MRLGLVDPINLYYIMLPQIRKIIYPTYRQCRQGASQDNVLGLGACKNLIKYKLLKLFAVSCVIMQAGCVGTYVNYIPNEHRTDCNASPQEIEILESFPSSPYTEMGIIKIRGASRNDIISVLKEKAYQIGADALIELEFEKGSETQAGSGAKGSYASSNLLWDVPRNKLGFISYLAAQAKAIKYIKEESGACSKKADF